MSAMARAVCLSLPSITSLALITACTSEAPVADPAASPETATIARAGISRVKHVIILMQENHSFDNYFGALAYAPGSPYHQATRRGDGDGDGDDRRGCRHDDHRCVD